MSVCACGVHVCGHAGMCVGVCVKVCVYDQLIHSYVHKSKRKGKCNYPCGAFKKIVLVYLFLCA